MLLRLAPLLHSFNNPSQTYAMTLILSEFKIQSKLQIDAYSLFQIWSPRLRWQKSRFSFQTVKIRIVIIRIRDKCIHETCYKKIDK